METEQTIRELVDFTATVGRTLANHRQQLQRHEQILLAQFKGGESHADAIKELRELVAAQSQLLGSLQRVVLRIAKSLGLDPEETTGTIN